MFSLLCPTGSWLEFDDLKYPQCTSHKSLPVPGHEIHMVFWEVQAGKPEGAGLGGRCRNYTPAKTGTGVDLSLTIPPDDTFIVEALTEDSRVSPNGADTSVGSATLLDAFEGLSHSDIVTLTLVEVKVDADGKALAGKPPAAVDSGCVSFSEGGGTPKGQGGKRGPSTGPRGMPEKAVQPDRSTVLPPSPELPPPALDLPLPTSGPPSPVSRAPLPSDFTATRWSTLLTRHPSFQGNLVIPKRVSPTPFYRPALKLATDDGLSDRAAEMFSGFQARPVAAATNGASSEGDDSRTKNEAFKQPWLKSACMQPAANNPPPPSLKMPHRTEGIPQTTLLGPTRSLKTHPSTALSDTSTLRLKLLKKLKRKKKLLDALDRVMGKEAPDSLQRPDSTEIVSPYAVSSTTSQCSSASYDEFFNDLLSPATTASNLSPDSTGLLEMLASGQDVPEGTGEGPAAKQPRGARGTDWEVPTPAENHLASAKDDFLEEFMSGAATQPGPTPENVDFNVFDMFF